MVHITDTRSQIGVSYTSAHITEIEMLHIWCYILCGPDGILYMHFNSLETSIRQ